MGERRFHRLPEDYRRKVIRLAAGGATYKEIQAELGLSPGPIARVLVPLGGVPPESGKVRDSDLSLDERIEIGFGIERGLSARSIACGLGRSTSTVTRELARNGGRDGYRPGAAHRAAQANKRRPKETKFEQNRELVAFVVFWLERLASPEQISGRLKAEFPDRPEMRVSPETIYKSLYVQGRGELRKELHECLRTGRAARKHRGTRQEQRGVIKDMVNISERPAEVEDRAVFGHWEGDLILGKNNQSAVGTLVERTTRYVMLLHLDGDHTAETVRDAMIKAIAKLPAQLRKTVTWDQGSEMARHAEFTVATDVAVYFCDPHSPWQRGTNENTNGLLRQYMPKGTDLSQHSEQDLEAIADSLNGRPRKTLGFLTPSEKLNELIALTG